MLYTSPHTEISVQSNPSTYSTTVLHPSSTCYYLSKQNSLPYHEKLTWHTPRASKGIISRWLNPWEWQFSVYNCVIIIYQTKCLTGNTIQTPWASEGIISRWLNPWEWQADVGCSLLAKSWLRLTLTSYISFDEIFNFWDEYRPLYLSILIP